MLKKFNIIGHRGFGPTDNSTVGCDYPENTLKAFKHVLDHGADGIELDIFLTADGVPVVIHDERLHDHVIETQKDKARTKPVSAHNFQQLKHFDLQSGEKIPSLQDVLKLVTEYNDPKIINLDVKDPNSVDAIMENIAKMGSDFDHPIVISSYNWDILRSFRKLSTTLHLVPAIKSATLFGQNNIEAGTYKPLTDQYQAGFEKSVIDIHREISASAFDCSITDFTPALVNLARSQGVGLQLSTGMERVNAKNTDYSTLNLLLQATQAGIKFVICKVDEPAQVKQNMGLKR